MGDVEIAQAQRGLAAPHQVTDLLARRGLQVEIDALGTSGEPAQHIHDVGVRERPDERERDGAALLADGGAHRLATILDRRENGLGKRQERAAGFGQLHAAAHAFEQRRPEVLLDQADAAADRRLRAVEPAGGAREPAELGDGYEGADFVDVHNDQEY